jgi:3-deoxy-D-manno-octulosonic-acid transferase
MNHLDLGYYLGMAVSSPFWLAKPSARRKVLGALSRRMGQVASRPAGGPALMIHAVSLGEINATRFLVDRLRQRRPGLAFIVSVTTDSGFARGRELYGNQPDVTLVRYPLDFSSVIDRLLDAVRPSVVVLLELEVWPNFMRRCARRKIPVLLINGRITPASFRKYRLARPLVGGMFARLGQVCAQDSTYAQRFEALGVAADRIRVTGTMKFDTADLSDHIDGQEQLAAAVGLSGAGRVWVCGSTGPGEESLILDVYRRLLARWPDLRLVIVPRKPERFDEVAALIAAGGFDLVRRSNREAPASDSGRRGPPVVLGDTLGELRKFYALANVVFVGRSLVDLGDRQHGSDMIEPAAQGKAVIVGPFTANFADAMRQFIAADAMLVVADAADLERSLAAMLENPARAAELGRRACQVVREQRGATDRHVQVILDTLDSLPTMGPQSTL